jgi:hypothetical protein
MPDVQKVKLRMPCEKRNFLCSWIGSARLLSCLLVVMLLCPSDGTSEVTTVPYTKAEIYYYGWDVLTRGRLSLDTVRTEFRTKTEIRDPAEVARLVRWLRLERMETSTDLQPEDPRLVIDLRAADGAVSTYYASVFNLLSEDSRKKRKIDQAFRNRFDFAK